MASEFVNIFDPPAIEKLQKVMFFIEEADPLVKLKTLESISQAYMYAYRMCLKNIVW